MILTRRENPVGLAAGRRLLQLTRRALFVLALPGCGAMFKPQSPGDPVKMSVSEAEQHARIAIAKRKRFLEAENTLAVILIHEEKYEEAEKVLVPITQDILYNTPEIAWGNLGWCYLGQG